MFEAAVANTSSDSLTSTLTTLTEVSALNGTTVSCLGQPPESLTIIVAGKLEQLYIGHMVILLSLFRASFFPLHCNGGSTKYGHVFCHHSDLVPSLLYLDLEYSSVYLL